MRIAERKAWAERVLPELLERPPDDSAIALSLALGSGKV
jgi:hypothetical protein